MTAADGDGAGGMANTAGSGGSGGSKLVGDGGMGVDAQSNDISLNPCPPPGTECRVMPLGDSITAGAKSSKGPYVNYINPMIATDMKSLKFYGNQGYSGFTIFPGAGRMGISDKVIADMDSFTPNVITLMIGTNDVDLQYDLENAPARLGQLLDLITAHDPKVLVIVAKIVPQNRAPDYSDDRVQHFNSGLPAIVKARQDAGKRVWLVDMHAAFVADPNWKTKLMDTDGLHPIDAGFSVMAAVWYDQLKRLD